MIIEFEPNDPNQVMAVYETLKKLLVLLTEQSGKDENRNN